MQVIYHDQNNITLCTLYTDNLDWIISAVTESKGIWLNNKPYTYDAMYLTHDTAGEQIVTSLGIFVNDDMSGTARAGKV